MKLLSLHFRRISEACICRSTWLLFAFLIVAVLPCRLSAGDEKIAAITFLGNETRESASLVPLLKSREGEEGRAEKGNEDKKTIEGRGM